MKQVYIINNVFCWEEAIELYRKLSGDSLIGDNNPIIFNNRVNL